MPATMSTSAPIALLLAFPAAGQESLRVELETLAGEVRERALADLDLPDPRSEGVAFVRFVGAALPASAQAPDPARRIVLTTAAGDHLIGGHAGGEGDVLRVELAPGTVVPVPVDGLRALRFPARLEGRGALEVSAPKAGDRLYLARRGGLDLVDGLLSAFSERGVEFESSAGLLRYDWTEVAALFVEPLGDPEPPEEELPPVVVDLASGSRLRGGLRALDAQGVALVLPAGVELRLAAEEVREVAVDDGSYRFLSELEPSDLGPLGAFGDDLGMAWPPRMDRSVTGGVLRAGGRSWTRGIGVHAPSRLTWELDGGWSELRVLVAIDDEVDGLPRGGSVRFRVHVDGELRYESPSTVTRETEPLALPPIELAGARSLVLEVDPDLEFHVADRADWLRPILVRG